MNVIVYGTKRCAETRKAMRFFQERRIQAHFRDVGAEPLSAGELRNLANGRDAGELLDTGSARYVKRGMAFMEFDPIEELERDPALLATPIVRVDRRFFVRPVLEDLPLS